MNDMVWRTAIWYLEHKEFLKDAAIHSISVIMVLVMLVLMWRSWKDQTDGGS